MTDIIIVSLIILSGMIGIVALIIHKYNLLVRKINITECNILDCQAQLYAYICKMLHKINKDESTPTDKNPAVVIQLKNDNKEN